MDRAMRTLTFACLNRATTTAFGACVVVCFSSAGRVGVKLVDGAWTHDSRPLRQNALRSGRLMGTVRRWRWFGSALGCGNDGTCGNARACDQERATTVYRRSKAMNHAAPSQGAASADAGRDCRDFEQRSEGAVHCVTCAVWLALLVALGMSTPTAAQPTMAGFRSTRSSGRRLRM